VEARCSAGKENNLADTTKIAWKMGKARGLISVITRGVRGKPSELGIARKALGREE